MIAGIIVLSAPVIVAAYDAVFWAVDKRLKERKEKKEDEKQKPVRIGRN